MAAQNYLITGAGRGIGRGLSRLLLRKGHRILLLDNDNVELENTSNLLSKSGLHGGKDFETCHVDLRNPHDITNAASKADDFFQGRLDCLINNAACQ